MLVICHERSNVISLNLSLKKKVQNTTKKSQRYAKIVKLPIKKIISIKKKGQNTTKNSQSCVKIVKLPIKKLIVFFFARQGLSGPYQMRSSSSSDMDLIILVLRKKTLIINIYS
jgi:hypothetical protein